jgi:hypothetical protein
MKVTIELPDVLYRQVKAKSALEGRPVRGVAEELFRDYVRGETGSGRTLTVKQDEPSTADSSPSWFGMLRGHVRRTESHDMEAIRESIGRGVARDRDL